MRRLSPRFHLAMALAAVAPLLTAQAPTGEREKDPYRAYEAGLYDQALQGFVDAQVERPEDPHLALNVGSAHYKMKNYGEAAASYGRAAATSEDPELRARALYNLGNVAFREGKLEEAVRLYQSALESKPDDPDAKFNLEFVRNEIRRRHEEAKKRQEQQKEKQQQGGEQQQKEQEQQGEQGQDEKQEKEEQQGQEEKQEQEQQQGQQGQQGQEKQEQAGQQHEVGQPEGAMSQDEAERLLAALSETRPEHEGEKGKRARKVRGGKDW